MDDEKKIRGKEQQGVEHKLQRMFLGCLERKQ